VNPATKRIRPLASVVVVACGDAEITLACLGSITGDYASPLQVIAVNNGAGATLQRALESCTDQLAQRDVDLNVIRLTQRLGACTARNLALPFVKGRYVAFIDNDTRCTDPAWVRRLALLLDSDETIGAVGPRIVAQATGRLECAGYGVDPRGQVRPLERDISVDRLCYRVPRAVQALGNFMAPTRLVRKIGGFDPAFDPFGFENIDCCYRIKRHGKRIVCDGSTDLVHVGHVTTGRFEQEGRRILFEKSLLLRRRWRHVFAQEAEEFARLTGEADVVPLEGTPR
jgi:O-antigen biosynthesis protein